MAAIDAQFGIGQGVEAIHPDGVRCRAARARRSVGGDFQAAGAHGEAAAGEFAIDFAVDGEEGVAERDIGQAGGEAGAIAAGRGEFVDGARQRIAEAVEVGDAGELGARDALRGLFDEQVEDGGGDLGGVAGVVADEVGEGLDEAGGEDEAFAGEAILQVLRHGGGGHQEAYGVSCRRGSDCAKAIEDVGGFAGAGGSGKQAHRLQCSAGRRKIETRGR